MFRWHKDALHFLSRHREALTERPVAISALDPITTGDEKEWQGSRDQLDKELAKCLSVTSVIGMLSLLGPQISPMF
jgi:menaquinone-dependent protoporphyrinogen IX oxidase